MQLSDEERRRLRELEEELTAEDPDLARHLQETGPSERNGALKVYGLLTIVAGFALVITGISTKLIVLGVMGFLAASAGAYLFLTGRSTHHSPRIAVSPSNGCRILWRGRRPDQAYQNHPGCFHPGGTSWPLNCPNAR